MDTPIEFNAYTADEFERMELHGQVYEQTDQADPNNAQLIQISHRLSQLSNHVPAKHRRILELYHQQHTKAQIIKQTRTTYTTINSVIKSTRGQNYLSLLYQVQELREGPSQTARRAMLWRIAKRAENKQPSICLKALDILNKQAKDYAPDPTELQQEQGLVVKTLNFQVTHNHIQPTIPTPDTTTTIEGEFTPVTVKVPTTDA